MVALFGVLSFIGLIVCIVLIIIKALRKKPVKPLATGFLVCFVIFVICLALTPKNVSTEKEMDQAKETESITQDNKKTEYTKETPESTEDNVYNKAKTKEDNPKKEESTATEPSEPENEENIKVIEYDALQKVFLTISDATIEEDILELIDKYGLKYTAQRYNGNPKHNTYRLAYVHDVALQKYSEPGDSLEIAFSEEDGSLMYAEYFNYDSFMNAVYYHHGTYWNLHKTGYFYHKPGESDYHSVQTPEDALSNIL